MIDEHLIYHGCGHAWCILETINDVKTVREEFWFYGFVPLSKSTWRHGYAVHLQSTAPMVRP